MKMGSRIWFPATPRGGTGWSFLRDFHCGRAPPPWPGAQQQLPVLCGRMPPGEIAFDRERDSLPPRPRRMAAPARGAPPRVRALPGPRPDRRRPHHLPLRREHRAGPCLRLQSGASARCDGAAVLPAPGAAADGWNRADRSAFALGVTAAALTPVLLWRIGTAAGRPVVGLL